MVDWVRTVYTERILGEWNCVLGPNSRNHTYVSTMLAEKLLAGCAVLLLLSTMARSCGTKCYPPLGVSGEAPSASAENMTILFARCHTACVDKVRFCYALWCIYFDFMCVFVCVCVYACMYIYIYTHTYNFNTRICIRMTSMPWKIKFFPTFYTHTFTHLDCPWFILFPNVNSFMQTD